MPAESPSWNHIKNWTASDLDDKTIEVVACGKGRLSVQKDQENRLMVKVVDLVDARTPPAAFAAGKLYLTAAEVERIERLTLEANSTNFRLRIY